MEGGFTMQVITITQKMGTLGAEIGQAVAEGLGYEYVDKARIKEIMAAYGIEEQEVEMFDEKRTPLLDSHLLDRRNFVHLLNAAIYDFARKGRAVIVGRGAQFLLRGLPEVFHVSVISPLSVRIQRLMASAGVDEKTATQLIRENDRDIDGYTQYFFRSNGSAQHDLEVDTEKLSVENGARRIIEEATRPETKKVEDDVEGRLADLTLSEKVVAGLFRKLGTNINYLDVRAEKGVVFLKGVVASDLIRESCEWIVAAMDGVAKVENTLISASLH